MKKRNTPSKEAILKALKASGSAMSHDMIQACTGNQVDRATIYRVLNSFCEDGKVHKIVGDDGKQYFALCLNCGEKKAVHTHNHIHFKCLECGKIECIHHDVSVSLPEGYIAKAYNLLVSGLCNECS